MATYNNNNRIFVDRLPDDIREREIKELFRKFGPIIDVEVKTRRKSDNSKYAFVEFEDPRDAVDAVKGRNGYSYAGYELRVEFTHEKGSRGNRDGFRKNEVKVGSTRSSRSHFRVRVSGIPSSGSWQDLKDHMRIVGDVCFADIVDHRGGVGIVEYYHYEDMKRAIRKLDDSKFITHEGDSGYIRVELATENSKSRSRSRSRSPRGDDLSASFFT